MKSGLQYLFKTFFQGLMISIVIACVMIFIEIIFGQTIELDAQFMKSIV
jgi:hypothetical protein